MEDFGFGEVEREVAPLAVVRDLEGLVPALGQRGFRVGGPVDCAIATGAALKAKRERVGAGGFDVRRIEGQSRIISRARKNELSLFNRERGVNTSTDCLALRGGHRRGRLRVRLFALRLALGLRHFLIAGVCAAADKLFLRIREMPVDRLASGGADSRGRVRGPVIPQLLQACGLLGLGFREIVKFGAVGCEIEQLPRAAPVGDELHVASDHGAMIEELKVKRLVRRTLFAEENGTKALARQGRDFFAGKFRRPLAAAGIHDGRHEIDDVRTLIGDTAALLHHGGPGSDASRGTAAIEHVALVVAERCLVRIRPSESIAEIRGASEQWPCRDHRDWRRCH